MAIYQPTNITPSSFAGEGGGVIDVNNNINISWQINGNEAMVAFKIFIYQNNAASTLVHQTGNLSVGCPAYPTSEKGNVAFFTYSPAQKWSAWSLANGNSYKMKIRQYWGANAANYVDQYADVVFEAKNTPQLTIYPFAVPVSTITQSVTATYYQAQGDAINSVRWQFYSVFEGEQTLIDDTGDINTSVLNYTCEGLLSGNTYMIACSVTTSSGVTVAAENITFEVFYDTESASDTVYVGCGDESAPIIRFSEGTNIPGKSSVPDGYSVSDGVLTINDGVNIAWDTVDGSDMLYDPPYTLKWTGTIERDADRDYLSVSGGNLLISSKAGYLHIYSDGVSIAKFEIPLGTASATAIIAPTIVNVRFDTNPYSWAWITWTMQKISSVSLYGEQICSLLLIANADGEIFFHPTFQTNIDAGSAGNVTATAIYRAAEGESRAQKIYTLPAEYHAIKDYGIKNGDIFSYEAFGVTSANTYLEPSVSETYCYNINSYWLYEASVDANDETVYHVLQVFEFDGNIESSQVSNNNQPTMLTNFTPYRLRQPMSVLGKSGTLTALIGNAVNGIYTDDTAAKMEKLFALSASPNVLFLKDTKGTLRMVHTAAPITQTVNIKQEVQSVTINLPWEEIGDINGISLIQTPADAGWEDDMEHADNGVLYVTGDVDVDTGVLSFTYPANYFGTVFGLDNGMLTARTPEGATIPTFDYNAPVLNTTLGGDENGE